MFRKTKEQRLTNLIMERSHGQIAYDEALRLAKDYYKNKPFSVGLFTHVGENYFVQEVLKRRSSNETRDDRL